MTSALLTPADLAEHFHVTERRVLQLARQHNWPRIQFGRTFRWTTELLEQIEREHLITPDAAEPANGLTTLSRSRSRST